MRGALSAFVLASATAALSACLPWGEPCCTGDAECADGLSCFEGRCAPRCDDEAEQADAQCDEGERCIPGAGVCRSADADVELDRCPYQSRDTAP